MITNDAEVYSYLGLAQRARKLVSGDASLVASLRKGEGKLLLIANDCGNNNRKKYVHLANREGIEYTSFGTGNELGRAIGKGRRMAILVTDSGFATSIRKRIPDKEVHI